MVHLIDKDALVAEIERRIKKSRDNANIARLNNNHSVTCIWAGHEKECHELKSFIDTLEVKEVDLDFMLHEYWNLSPHITIDCLENATMTKDEMINFAKHFFELGLKAQKGEEI